MKKTIFIAVLLLLISYSLIAQTKPADNSGTPNAKPANRFYYGGNFGFTIDEGGTGILVQPIIGYRLTTDFSTGLNIYYEYNEYKHNYIAHAYGIGPFARYEVPVRPDIFGLVFHAEYSYGGSSAKYTNEQDWNSITLQRLPLGAGIFIQTGVRGRLSVVALWDVINLNNNRYNNSGAPSIRIGYTF